MLNYVFQISPFELEGVIRQHPGVLDAAVTGIPDPECGELPVACVVRRNGYDVTAQEIKDLVKGQFEFDRVVIMTKLSLSKMSLDFILTNLRFLN